MPQPPRIFPNLPQPKLQTQRALNGKTRSCVCRTHCLQGCFLKTHQTTWRCLPTAGGHEFSPPSRVIISSHAKKRQESGDQPTPMLGIPKLHLGSSLRKLCGGACLQMQQSRCLGKLHARSYSRNCSLRLEAPTTQPERLVCRALHVNSK